MIDLKVDIEAKKGKSKTYDHCRDCYRGPSECSVDPIVLAIEDPAHAWTELEKEYHDQCGGDVGEEVHMEGNVVDSIRSCHLAVVVYDIFVDEKDEEIEDEI